ncbi:unnamed protein product [Eruca vesicaria subsp. sativa]|uniref:VQ domain-containing protein n=1 Tax=Eruca vesicaria subsp. sativa TaxID=29727 RepID=A0ABC8J7X3_ERUVS|nr:unnamed protein product [Eruca vesicaria subsp. sativa]
MMDKSCNNSSADSTVSASATSSSTGNNKDNHYLRQLNKLSHKISKPTSSSISAAVNQETDHQPQMNQMNQGNLHQHQPPVYNINKNDFRDVVQKLTGSPAHERISSPPQQPIHHPPKAQQQSSRLHRIRPPPLAHVINRPPTLLNSAAPPNNWNNGSGGGGFGFVPRPNAPLSPLPPLPPVHAAAESPVSSYMRYLQNSMMFDSNRKEFSPLAPLVSPRWYQQQQENAPPPLNSRPSGIAPVSVSAATQQSFGCLSSPKSPYGLLSPSLLLSPTSGQLGFPVSPTTVPLPSPK